MSQAQKATVHNHTELPARPDLIRLIIGIFGIGSSGPLIALSAMPVPTLIFWRNLGGSLMTLPFALRHKLDRSGVKWAVLAGIVLSVHFVGFFLSMRMTSVTAGTAIVATQPIFAAFFVKLTGGHIPTKAWLGMLISFTGVVVVTGIDLQLDRRSFMGDLAALISGALAAAYMLIGSRAQQTLATTSYTTICYFVCAMTALPMALLSGYDIVGFALREWWILLGLIIEKITGETLAQQFRKRIFEPLKMSQTFFEYYEPAIGSGKMAHSFLGKRDITKILNTSYDWAGGGVVSTNADLATFLRGIFEGKLYKKDSTLSLMTKMLPHTLKSGRVSYYGLGLYQYTFNGEKYYGHGGFWGSIIAYNPTKKIIFCGTVNQVNPPFRTNQFVESLLSTF